MLSIVREPKKPFRLFLLSRAPSPPLLSHTHLDCVGDGRHLAGASWAVGGGPVEVGRREKKNKTEEEEKGEDVLSDKEEEAKRGAKKSEEKKKGDERRASKKAKK